jgi:homoserine/homoserine lactone efflux protein
MALQIVGSGIVGLLVGIVLALPLGPVSLATLRTSLQYGVRAGISVAVGAALLDVVYCLLALLATGVILKLLGFVDEHPLLSLVVRLCCVAVLLGYGAVQVWRKREKPPAPSSSPLAVKLLAQRFHHRHGLALGVGMALVNLANPAFLPSLLYLGVLVHQFHWVQPEQMMTVVAFAGGFGTGNLLWLSFLAYGMHHFRRRLSGESLERLYRLMGLALIGVGTLLGVRVLMATKWHELARLLPVF